MPQWLKISMTRIGFRGIMLRLKIRPSCWHRAHLDRYDVTYHPRKAIDEYALADVIVEFTIRDSEGEDTTEVVSQWKLFVDGALNDFYSRAWVFLKTAEGRSVYYPLRLEFCATNNETKYEALTVGLKIVKELEIKAMHIYNDSQLVFCQVKGEY